MKNRNKMNNNGFSLVELIIVIAIMAVLIGVLAPQYMKYVERGKKSTDVQNVSAVCGAIEVYASDPMAANAPATGTVKFTTTSTAVTTAASNDFLQSALTDAGIKDIVLKSSKWGATTITLKVEPQDDGTVKFSIEESLSADHDILKGQYK